MCQIRPQISALTKKADCVPVLFHGTQAVVRHDMIADVQDDLNGQLEIPLDISNHKRIFDELLKRPAPQYSQQTDVFAQFPKALCDQHWISQSRSPLKDAS